MDGGPLPTVYNPLIQHLHRPCWEPAAVSTQYYIFLLYYYCIYIVTCTVLTHPNLAHARLLVFTHNLSGGITIIPTIWVPMGQNVLIYCMTSTVGAENMFPFRSELRWKTSFEVRRYFVRSSGLLRTKFEAISFKVRRYFERNSPLCTNFSPTSNELQPNFERTSSQLRTNFASTLNELRPNFERTSSQLRTNFEPIPFEVREVRTSHGNIISAATVCCVNCSKTFLFSP